MTAPAADYRAVLAQLEAVSRPEVLADVAMLPPDVHLRFAWLVAAGSVSRVRFACRQVLGIGESADEVTAWLVRVAPTFLLRLGSALAQASAPAPTLPPARRLTLDARLGPIPLLQLAAELAAEQPGQTLEVRAHALDAAVALVDRSLADRTVITIDVARARLQPGGVAFAWAHELAHLLDTPGPATPDREQRADELACRLLDERPTSAAAARALAGEPSVPSDLVDELAVDTIELVAFGLLELTVAEVAHG